MTPPHGRYTPTLAERAGLSRRRLTKLVALILAAIAILGWSLSPPSAAAGIPWAIALVAAFLFLALGVALSLYAFIDRKLPVNTTFWRLCSTLGMLAADLAALLSGLFAGAHHGPIPRHAQVGLLALIVSAALLIRIAINEYRYHAAAKAQES